MAVIRYVVIKLSSVWIQRCVTSHRHSHASDLSQSDQGFIYPPGADPGFRRGGGRFVHSEGGGGFVQEFQERIQIVAGSWANQQANKNCRQP